MSWHPRPRGVRKTRRGAMALFDIVNLKQRQASAAPSAGALAAPARQHACVRFEARTFVSSCFEMRARDGVRPLIRTRAPWVRQTILVKRTHVAETQQGSARAVRT